METTPLLVAVVAVPVGDEGAEEQRLGGLTLKELLLEAETRRWCRLRRGALWLLWVTWCVALVAAVALAVTSPSCVKGAAVTTAGAAVTAPQQLVLLEAAVQGSSLASY